MREAARHGPLILLPSHKSHVDYLVLSDVFYAHQLSPPLIAAGDNLSFWPLGPILRRGGAFFIRRSFKGKQALQRGRRHVHAQAAARRPPHRAVHRRRALAHGQALAAQVRPALDAGRCLPLAQAAQGASASLGPESLGLYEPVHGSAPDIAGAGVANPIATCLSAAMMLRYSLGAPEAADRIDAAVDAILDDGARTRDLGGELGTREVADRLLGALR